MNHVDEAKPTERRTPGEPLLRVTDLRVVLPFGRRNEVEAVRSVSLQVQPGERIGIVGESGSGKSVTGRAIAGLLPTSPRVRVTGSIAFHGKEMVGAPDQSWDKVRSFQVGMVFQDPLTYLNPVMKVGAQVRESIPRHRRTDREDATLEFLSLAGLDNARRVAGSFPHELSGGMRQRVLIAIALAKTPELILADEPTTALDATVQKRVLGTLRESVATLNTSLILISHDLAVISEMTDRVYVMFAGRVVETGPTAAVVENPRHPYTVALLRSVRSLAEDSVDLFSVSPQMRSAWLDEPVSTPAVIHEMSERGGPHYGS